VALLSLSVLVLGAGCGKSAEESLVGKWRTPCHDGEAMVIEFKKGGAYESTYYDYATNDCSGAPTDVNSGEDSGTYVVGVESAQVSSAHEMDITEVHSATSSTTTYTVFKLEGDRLSLGTWSAEHDGSTAEKRHRSLDGEFGEGFGNPLSRIKE
jgi:hypothetical protein